VRVGTCLIVRPRAGVLDETYYDKSLSSKMPTKKITRKGLHKKETGLCPSFICFMRIGGNVVRKNKTWGDEGFTTVIKYGAYDYTVKFVSE